MYFQSLFKKVSGDPQFISHIEKMIHDFYRDGDNGNLSQGTHLFDEDREMILVNSLHYLKDKIPADTPIIGYDPDRSLNIEKIYGFMSSDLQVFAQKLQKAFFNKDLDSFFNLILKNNYTFTYNSQTLKTQISIEGEEYD